LDANNGQNAVNQVKAFDAALGVTGIILTKLDGTAKGGAIAAIARHKPIALRFIGIGEAIDDLRPFFRPAIRGGFVRGEFGAEPRHHDPGQATLPSAIRRLRGPARCDLCGQRWRDDIHQPDIPGQARARC
jgi:hypothetical protein